MKNHILKCFSVIAMSSKTTKTPRKNNTIRIDTDSAPIGIDNRCSLCISHVAEDFIGELVETNRRIKGFGGLVSQSIKMGTLLWRWDDDQGRQHKFIIPNSLYVPSGRCRLLSPQHWAQTRKGVDKPAMETTTDTQTTLTWGNQQYKLTVPLGKGDNVATLQMSPGFNQYELFCEAATAEHKDEENPIPQSTPIVSDDEGEYEHTSSQNEIETQRTWESAFEDAPECIPIPENEPKQDQQSIQSMDESQDQPRAVTFESEPHTMRLPTESQQTEDLSSGSDTALLLRYHYKYGHISFHKLKKMAQQGIIPTRLKDTYTPTCLACQYAKATRKPWRNKKQKHFKKPIQATKPGQVVSVDQLVSPTPGLIAQMTGILTTKRYKYATVYVDQFSKFSYFHLQKTATVEETLESKHAFEKYAASHGVQILHYHADNGIFRANKWVQSCQSGSKPQGMTFAGVDAHHTNGLAERRIRDIQDNGRAMLIHASHKWKSHITANLWPYALRTANHAYNNTPLLNHKEGKTPTQLFTSTEVQDNPKHWRPFGCPTYVLKPSLRSNARIHHKWKRRSDLGIYLGHSPVHHRNVALVLNPLTGLVSPQFHVRFDPFFTTSSEHKSPSQWQALAGFVSTQLPTTTRQQRASRRHQENHLSMTQLPPPNPLHQEGDTHHNSLPPPYKGLLPPDTTPPDTNVDVDNQEGEQFSHQEGEEQFSHQEKGEFEVEEPELKDSTAQPEGVEQPPKKRRRRWHTSFQPQNLTKRQPKKVNRLEMAMQTIAELLMEEITQENIPGEIFCNETLFPDSSIGKDDLLMQLDPMYAFKATSDPDSMYLHQAMREPD